VKNPLLFIILRHEVPKNLLRRPFGYASGWQKKGSHSERSVSGAKNLLRRPFGLRLRVTKRESFWGSVSDRRISSGDPSAYASGWQKRGHSVRLFCHSERSVSGAKNLLRRPFGLRLRVTKRGSFWGSVSDRRISSGDPSATPQGDKKRGVILNGA